MGLAACVVAVATFCLLGELARIAGSAASCTILLALKGGSTVLRTQTQQKKTTLAPFSDAMFGWSGPDVHDVTFAGRSLFITQRTLHTARGKNRRT